MIVSSCFLERELWFLKLSTIDIWNDQLQFTQKLKIHTKRSLDICLRTFPCSYNVGFKPFTSYLPLFLTFHQEQISMVLRPDPSLIAHCLEKANCKNKALIISQKKGTHIISLVLEDVTY